MHNTDQRAPVDAAELRATLDEGARNYIARRIAEGLAPAVAEAEVDVFCVVLAQGFRAMAGGPGDRTADLLAARARFLAAGGTDAQLSALCRSIRDDFAKAQPIAAE